MTFEQLASEWLEECRRRGLAPSTIRQYEYLLDTRLLPTFGSCDISAITPEMIRSFMVSLTTAEAMTTRSPDGKLSPCVQRKYRVCLHSVLQLGVTLEHLHRNPCAAIPGPKVPKPDITIVQPQGLQAFIDAMDELPTIQFCYFRLMLESGARREEMVGANWSDFDLDQGLWLVQAACQSIDGHTQRWAEMKTPAGKRMIALSSPLCDILMEWKKESDELRNDYFDRGKLDRDAFDACFTLPPHAKDGTMQRICKDTPSKWFRRWLDRHPELPQGMTLYSLRHQSASLLINAGADPRAVSERLGHADPGFTMRVYSQMFSETDRRLADTIAQRLEDVHSK